MFNENEDHPLTPMQMLMLLWHYSSPTKCEIFPETETKNEQFDDLVGRGLIEGRQFRPGAEMSYKTTRLGSAYVNQVMRTPIPEVETWYRFEYEPGHVHLVKEDE